MKLLKCKLCRGEVDIIKNERAVHKKIKCRQCGFTNENEVEKKFPEVIVIRRAKNPHGQNN